jgi:D-arabinose 5-phosphate isomerase GutQ
MSVITPNIGAMKGRRLAIKLTRRGEQLPIVKPNHELKNDVPALRPNDLLCGARQRISHRFR